MVDQLPIIGLFSGKTAGAGSVCLTRCIVSMQSVANVTNVAKVLIHRSKDLVGLYAFTARTIKLHVGKLSVYNHNLNMAA